MPIRIEYTMDSGKVFTETKCSFKEGKPFSARSEAIVQAQGRLKDYLYVAADDGTWIVCSHISSIKIVED